VTVDGDVLDESDETFTLVLSGATNAAILDGTGLGTILDDDLPPDLSIADLAVPEGNAGSSTASIPVTLSAASGKPITVDYATVDGTAAAGSDYVAAAGALSFAPGETATTIDLTVTGDTTFESDEDLFVVLSGETNVQVADPSATVTIANDDPLPGLSVDDVSVAEGDAGDVTLSFTVSLSGPSAFPVSVDVATADGTAAAPGDYASAAATLTFAPGQLSLPVDVTVHGDAVFERDETLTIGLSNPAGATVADGTGIGTIAGDDAAPVLDVAGVTLSEGDAGDAIATFVITLSGSTDLPAGVDVATADGTATAPADFAPLATSLTFAPGETTKTVDVTIHGETIFEDDEDLSLGLSNPVDATVGTATATGTIVNDDPVPAISIADATVIEGNAGSANATLTLSLVNASAFATTVDVATADGSAVSPLDYAAATGTVTFAPGDLTATFDVAVTGDALYEGDETFSVVLAAPVGGTLADPTGDVTIVDDEGRPVLSVGDATVTEPDHGTAPATFTVTLSAPSSFPVVVEYATVDGTAGPDDFTPATGTITLSPGAVGDTVTVDVLGDFAVEPDEGFTLELRNPVGALVGDGSGLGTIVNDDDPPQPTVSVDPVAVREGDQGMTFVTFTVRLSNAAASDVVARYLTMDASATGGEDYAAATGQVSIPAGQETTSVEIAVLGDETVEPTETFELALVWATGAETGTDGTATIVNDDRLATRMSIRGRGIAGSRISVRGRLVAPQAGLDVSVTLYRRVGHRWVEVRELDVETTATGRTTRSAEVVTLFRARFRQVEPGRYLVRAAFRGDDVNAPSHARDRFRLR
jgi:chitinase